MGTGMNLRQLTDFEAAKAAVDQEAPVRKRLSQLFDDGKFTEIGGIGEKGTAKGVVAAYGMVEGAPVYAFSQDITQSGGAVGRLQAAKICKLYELAGKTGAPIVGIYDSNGAKADEGTDVLAAYGNIMSCVSNISGVVPQVSVIAGVCAGSMAMIAAGADIVVMSEKGSLFMTPPYTAGEADAGSAKAAMESGAVHILAEDDMEAVAKAREILSVLPANNLSGLPAFEFAVNEQIDTGSAYGAASTTVDADSMIELQADFGAPARCGFATVNGTPVGFAAIDGELTADSCAKLTRHINLCDCFTIPVVTFINTVGFASSVNGNIREGAKLAYAYAAASAVKIAVVTGDAYGAAYTVLAGAGADMVYAWPNASIGALVPATAVELMYSDKITENYTRSDAECDYAEKDAGALAAAANGIVDSVILPEETRTAVFEALELLEGKRTVNLPKKHGNFPM